MGNDTHVSDVSWMVHQLTELFRCEVYHVDNENLKTFSVVVFERFCFEFLMRVKKSFFRAIEIFLGTS